MKTALWKRLTWDGVLVAVMLLIGAYIRFIHIIEYRRGLNNDSSLESWFLGVVVLTLLVGLWVLVRLVVFFRRDGWLGRLLRLFLLMAWFGTLLGGVWAPPAGTPGYLEGIRDHFRECMDVKAVRAWALAHPDFRGQAEIDGIGLVWVKVDEQGKEIRLDQTGKWTIEVLREDETGGGIGLKIAPNVYIFDNGPR